MSAFGSLDAAAKRLSRTARHRAPFHLAFLTDGDRIPDPTAVASRMPKGSVVILRDYGKPAAERFALASALRAATEKRGVHLLIGADPSLASAVGAEGAHLPGWYDRRAGDVRLAHPNLWLTASAHDAHELRTVEREPVDAVFLSPVFPTRSHPQSGHLGVKRLAGLVRGAKHPVLALGGVDARTIRQLQGSGVAGVGAIEAFGRL